MNGWWVCTQEGNNQRAYYWESIHYDFVICRWCSTFSKSEGVQKLIVSWDHGMQRVVNYVLKIHSDGLPRIKWEVQKLKSYSLKILSSGWMCNMQKLLWRWSAVHLFHDASNDPSRKSFFCNIHVSLLGKDVEAHASHMIFYICCTKQQNQLLFWVDKWHSFIHGRNILVVPSTSQFTLSSMWNRLLEHQQGDLWWCMFCPWTNSWGWV